VGPTSIASNGRGDILAAVVGKTDSKVHVATRTCATGAWSATTTLNAVGWPLSRVSLDNKVGLTAMGNRFAVAIRGDGNAPLMMMQSAGTNDAPAWPTAFEAISLNTTVIEAPTLSTFRGVVMAAARGTNNSAYYALRNPNTVAYRSDRPMWTGGRIISGWGVGAVPPLFVAAGRRTMSAGDYSPLPNVPDDLYVLTKGIGDRQIYGINFGSFAALDIMQNVYGVRFEADEPINAVPNMWDQLQGFLSSPSAYWSEQGAPTSCNPAQFTTVYLSSRYGEVTFEGCNYPRRSLRLDDRGGAASFMWQEWGHVISWGTSGFKTSNFESIFNVLKPKTCSTNADCGGGTCAAVQSGSTPEGNVGKGALVCYSDSTMQRYQGFVWYWGTGWDYDMTVDEHSFLDFATFYRWWGDELRAWVAQDNAQGNGLLAQKYAWIRDNFYGGVEFNGSRAISGNAATSDETVGAYGMPLQ